MKLKELMKMLPPYQKIEVKSVVPGYFKTEYYEEFECYAGQIEKLHSEYLETLVKKIESSNKEETIRIHI